MSLDNETTFLLKLSEAISESKDFKLKSYLEALHDFFSRVQRKEDISNVQRVIEGKIEKNIPLTPAEQFIYLFVTALCGKPYFVLSSASKEALKQIIEALLKCAEDSSDLEFAEALEGLLTLGF